MNLYIYIYVPISLLSKSTATVHIKKKSNQLCSPMPTSHFQWGFRDSSYEGHPQQEQVKNKTTAFFVRIDL